MSCKYCDMPIYIKVRRYTASLLAPLTEIGAMQQEIIDKTGVEFVKFTNNFCPECGRNLKDKAVEE